MTIRILEGDVLAMLAELNDESVDCCVTSPPYWGLRDYGVKGQIGMERSLGAHLEVMVGVFREVRRVLKKTGTLWLNYGDCYATSPNGRSAAATKATGNDDRTFRDKPFSTIGPILGRVVDRCGASKMQQSNRGSSGGHQLHAGGYLKAKDLCMIPNRLAIALQEDGWWVRSEIIWGKNNPMPDSSGKYRPSTAHEKIFLLSKSGKMFYDFEAVAMPCSDNTHLRVAQDVANQKGSDRANGGARHNGPMKAAVNKNLAGNKPRSFHKERADGLEFCARPKQAEAGSGVRANASFEDAISGPLRLTRYLRNYEPPPPFQIWEMSTQSFKDAHFATFPTELPERCIKAGCPKDGVVLDIFGGAGTTGLVADRLQRDAILIELNPEYAEMARRRIAGDAPMFTQVE